MWNCSPCGMELILEKNQNILPIQCEIMNRHEELDECNKEKLDVQRLEYDSALIIQNKWKSLIKRQLYTEIKLHSRKLQKLHRLLKES